MRADLLALADANVASLSANADTLRGFPWG